MERTASKISCMNALHLVASSLTRNCACLARRQSNILYPSICIQQRTHGQRFGSIVISKSVRVQCIAVVEMVIGAPVSSRGGIAQDEEILEDPDCLAELAEDVPGDEDAD